MRRMHRCLFLNVHTVLGSVRDQHCLEAVRSRLETSQIVKNASGIENSAGPEYGKIASLYPSVLTHTVSLRMTIATAEASPTKPPMNVPSVVAPFQNIVEIKTGKLQLAAIANASPTMNATF